MRTKSGVESSCSAVHEMIALVYKTQAFDVENCNTEADFNDIISPVDVRARNTHRVCAYMFQSPIGLHAPCELWRRRRSRSAETLVTGEVLLLGSAQFYYEAVQKSKLTQQCTLRVANCRFYRTDYNIKVYMHCNFICRLSDVTIKTFSQSVVMFWTPIFGVK